MSYLEQLKPTDHYNQTLQSNVHPIDWTNPVPDGRYNLVVIGAGTAGLVSMRQAMSAPNTSSRIRQIFSLASSFRIRCSWVEPKPAS